MDRRTNRPEGSGVASPTVVTSRPNGEDLDVEDDPETRPSDIVTPPRKATSGSGRSASGTTPVPNGNGSDHTPHGALAASDTPVQEPGTDGLADGASPGEQPETAQPEKGYGAGADATIADGVPALPADNLRPSRGSRAKDSSPDPGTSQSLADDSPTFSFDRPEAAPVSPGTDDRTASPPAESSAEDLSWAAPSSSLSSRSGLAGDSSAGRVAGRIRLGDARPAGEFTVVSGAELPAGRDGHEYGGRGGGHGCWRVRGPGRGRQRDQDPARCGSSPIGGRP